MVRAKARSDAVAGRGTSGHANRDGSIQEHLARDQSTMVRPKAAKRKPLDEAAELANLPSARATAARVRGRPIGAVIVDICRDLGINGTHPLWGEVLEAITVHGGNRARMVNIVMQRGAACTRAELDALAPDSAARFDRVCAALWPSSWATPPP